MASLPRAAAVTYTRLIDEDRNALEIENSFLTMSATDRFKGIANRLLYSTYYSYFYFILAFFSLLSLYLSFRRTCPSTFELCLEMFINIALILEVSLRLIALGKNYWKSILNIFDIAVLAFCLLTLFAVMFSNNRCTTGQEVDQVADGLILVFRYGIGFVRLVSILKNGRGQSAGSSSIRNIDFADLNRTLDMQNRMV